MQPEFLHVCVLVRVDVRLRMLARVRVRVRACVRACEGAMFLCAWGSVCMGANASAL